MAYKRIKMFSKTPRKAQEKQFDRDSKEQLLLASDSHSVILLNALPLASNFDSIAAVLPRAGLAVMTIPQNLVVWDYMNVISFDKYRAVIMYCSLFLMILI